MAEVNIRVHSDFDGDFDRQITAIKSLADSLEVYIGYIHGDHERHIAGYNGLHFGLAELAASINELNLWDESAQESENHLKQVREIMHDLES